MPPMPWAKRRCCVSPPWRTIDPVPDQPSILVKPSLSIYYMTETRSGELRLSWDGELDPAGLEFLALFGTVHAQGVTMVGLQKATRELKLRVAAFVAQHGQTVPQLKAFDKLIRDLRDETHFLMLPSEPASTSDRLYHEQVIAHLNDPAVPRPGREEDPSFGPLLRHYDMRTPETDRPNSSATGARLSGVAASAEGP